MIKNASSSTISYILCMYRYIVVFAAGRKRIVPSFIQEWLISESGHNRPHDPYVEFHIPLYYETSYCESYYVILCYHIYMCIIKSV